MNTADGRRWVSYRELDYDDSDFPAIGEAFEQATGAARVGSVAQATARLMPQRALVDFAAEWMSINRGRKEESTDFTDDTD